MEEFTVWEVYVEFLNYDLGWVRHNYGLYSEYDEAVVKRNEVADGMAGTGLDFKVFVKGRKVNEKGRSNGREGC